jgi:putative FmdB family regulatory protein
MPIYEYTCSACGKTSDVLQKLNDSPPDHCELCGSQGTLTKVVSRSSFVLKGGGWYSDLYGSTKKDGGSSGGTASDSSKTEASKTDAAKTEATKTDATKKESAPPKAPAASTPSSSSSG